MEEGRKRSAEQMYPLIENFLDTKKSVRLFCEENSLEIHTFRYWLSKYKRELENNDESTFSKVQLELPESAQNIVIRTRRGLEIVIPV